jgi:hypothetical protein
MVKRVNPLHHDRCRSPCQEKTDTENKLKKRYGFLHDFACGFGGNFWVDFFKTFSRIFLQFFIITLQIC